MPTYDYECTKGHTFDVFQRITDEPLVKCQTCRAKARRVISAASFILKGSGWYADGYSKPKPGQSSSGEASASGDSGGKSSGDSASKSSGDPGSKSSGDSGGKSSGDSGGKSSGSSSSSSGSSGSGSSSD